MDMSLSSIEALWASLLLVLSSWGLKVLAAIAIFVVGRWIAGRLRRFSESVLKGKDLDPTLTPFISSLIYWVVFASAVIAALQAVGVQAASLIAVLGAAGLAVGLALQGTLSNVASGVMLLLFRPFDVGHYVEVGGTSGSVISLGLFTTTLHTPDNVQIVVPNSAIYGNTIKNYSANETRRVDLVVGISYGDDIQVAMDTIRSVLGADSRVLEDPAPQVAVSELGDSSVNLVVRPWCKGSDYWDLRFDLTRRLKEQLEAAGCNIPFPQRDVHLYQISAD